MNKTYTDFDFTFKIRIKNDTNDTKSYKISGKNLLVPGLTLGLESRPNVCYYAVFRSMVPNSAKMYVGNMFFDDKYVVWDQTPI